MNAIDSLFTLSDFVLGAREGVLPFPEVGVLNGHEAAYGLGKVLGSGAGLMLDLQLSLASITTGLSGAAGCGTGVLCVAGAPMAAAGALGATLAAGLSAAHVGKYVDGLDQIKKGRDYYTAAERLQRYNGPKPTYHVNPAHVPESRYFNPRKTPVPDDAAEVFQRAVPDAPTDARHWYGINGEGRIYRFSNANDGTAHFSGMEGAGDGIRNITEYALKRLGR